MTSLPCPLGLACNSTALNVTKYGGAYLSPAPSFALADYFGTKQTSDSTTKVSVSVLDQSCGAQLGYLSGLTTATSV